MAVHPIVNPEIEYFLVSRSPETAIRLRLAEAGFAMTEYGVLTHGCQSVSDLKDRSDLRAQMPRCAQDNRLTSATAVTKRDALARERGHTPVQLAIKWVLSRGAMVVQVVGSRRRDQVQDALDAFTTHQDDAQRSRREGLVSLAAVTGIRCPAEQMRTLESDRQRRRTPHTGDGSTL